MTKYLIITLIWSALNNFIQAAEVALMPEMIKFRMTFRPERSEKTPTSPSTSVSISQIKVIRTGETRLDQTLYSDGSEKTTWYLGVFLFSESPDGKPYQVSRETFVQGLGFRSIDAGRFPGVAWVSSEWEVGPKVLNGKKCVYYKKLPKEGPKEDLTTPSSLEAWIDVETRLPVAWKASDVFVSFEYLEPPVSPLDPGPKITAQYQAYQRAWAPPQRKTNR